MPLATRRRYTARSVSPRPAPARRRGIKSLKLLVSAFANTRLGFEQSDLRPDEIRQSRHCCDGRRESGCNQPPPGAN